MKYIIKTSSERIQSIDRHPPVGRIQLVGHLDLHHGPYFAHPHCRASVDGQVPEQELTDQPESSFDVLQVCLLAADNVCTWLGGCAL